MLVLAGCGGPTGAPDGGAAPDAASRDGGGGSPDAEMPAPDAGSGAPDAGGPDAGAPDAGSDSCPPPPACDAAPPDYGPLEDWRHSVASPITTSQGAPRHRGRDLILRVDDEQWAIAKLAYGFADDDLEDEDVDIYLLRGCTTWELLGTATSTDDGADPHPTVERVEDDGGRIFFQIPTDRRLGPGRHRLHFVVRGDHSTADQYVEVLSGTERFVVSDVDGTLTESETAEFATLISGPSPAANPGAPDAMWALASRGHRILYLTARPDWLTTRTHEWLDERGFPPGLVHTTLGGTGALGSAAAAFKSEELTELSARLGGPPGFGFGNKESDAAAYLDAGIDPAGRYLYQLDGDAMGGVHFDDYAALVSGFEAGPLVCR